jgi:23S rRNA (adenine2503-C2)-methyltransferase
VALLYVRRMLALQACTPDELTRRLPELTLREARKIVSAVHRGKSLEAPVPQVRRESQARVRDAGHLPRLTIRSRHESRLDPFVKLALATADERVIEAVRIPLEKAGRYSVCLSSQAGCALACAFCATGRLGLLRNLEAWEIVEQVRLVRDELPAGGRVHGVVFQGMGEPLANLDRVLTAIDVLSEPSAMAIDARNVTVCTAGLPAGIRKLASLAPKVRLAVSVHSAIPSVRARIMPISLAHPLDEVVAATADHARTTGLVPMWAVTLLAGVNDSVDDALALGALAASFKGETGKWPRLSIIAYNSIDAADDPFTRSPPEVEVAFRDTLKSLSIPTHRRYSGGSDVGAACGQLAGKV